MTDKRSEGLENRREKKRKALEKETKLKGIGSVGNWKQGHNRGCRASNVNRETIKATNMIEFCLISSHS